MKRTLRLIGLLLVCLAVVAPVSAQRPAGTPIGGAGLPELHIRVDSSGTDIPGEVAAGRTLISFENASERTLHPLIMRLPKEVGFERAISDLGSMTNGTPAWLLDSEFPGFVGETRPGTTSRVVIDLIAGNYILMSTEAVPFEVVGASTVPLVQQAPTTDAVVSLFDYGFRLPASIEPGQQVWEVTNNGTVPHEILLLWTPDMVTRDEMMASLSLGESATPVRDDIAQPVPVGGMGWLSPEAVAWTEVDLQPGSYLVLCFVYDPDRRATHLDRDMVDFFTIEGNATPDDATPGA